MKIHFPLLKVPWSHLELYNQNHAKLYSLQILLTIWVEIHV